jgi:ADP-ribose pyrophosphatase YjhB (NUDIX family)
MNSNPHWLDAADWKWVQDTVPVACVDVLPLQLATDGRTIARVGMIYRDTPHQGRRWCLVGGRMWRNESLVEAATRQIRETLGTVVRFHITPEAQPHYVAQYFTSQRNIGLLDPRQHAVAMVFAVPIEGEIVAGGEAAEFAWFAPDALPPADRCGFGQDRVAHECIENFVVNEMRFL